MKRVLIVVALLAVAACSHNPPPTPIAGVADIGSKIEASTLQLLHTATSLHASAPTLMTDARLAAVAMVTEKVGREGLSLADALDAYRAIKASHGDTTAQAAAIRSLINSITTALRDIGQAIPPGILSAIDAGVNAILGILASIQLSNL